jgi:16S rRNA (cytosine1402-N4)-methyltransferase
MHVPVLIEEVVNMLNLKRDGLYVDATVGLGGHSERILSLLSAKGKLIGIDKDEEALKIAKKRLGNHRVILQKGSFSNLKDLLLENNIHSIDGILFDLGLSMLQIKSYERGFSFLSDEMLDMRMDKSQPLTAWDVVNKYPEERLEKILKEYSDEPFARKIARQIVLKRKKSPINTCSQLAELVSDVYKRKDRIHPATKTFQAIRIEVNREIDELNKGLQSAIEVLNPGGRLCVISYHSIEDRLVKNFMRNKSKEGLLKILTKKPIMPSFEEIRNNPSSRSAKLRVGEKI